METVSEVLGIKTLRDEFAMAAMQGLLSNDVAIRNLTDICGADRDECARRLCNRAWWIADALLAARSQGETPAP